MPGAEGRTAELLAARDWDYVVGSIDFLRDRALDLREPNGTSGRAPARTMSGAGTSRPSATRPRAGSSTCSPTRTW